MITATVTSSSDVLRQAVFVGDRHWVMTDEPDDLGGADTAPTPFELLPAALAACVVTTLRMYARRKGWELGQLSVEVRFDTESRPQRCAITVELPDGLTGEQRERLEHVADACAVHRTLERGVVFSQPRVLVAS